MSLEISHSARTLLNDPRRVRERDGWFARLSSLFGGNRDADVDTVFTLMGFVGRAKDGNLAYTDPEAYLAACLEDLADQLARQPAVQRFAPACVEYPAYGVHFVDQLLGAEVFFQDGQWNARYLTSPVGELTMPDLDKQPDWALAKRHALAFVAADLGLPLYGLPTLSSSLNIAVNLYGEEALVALLDHPQCMERDLKLINALIIELHHWYQRTIPAAQLQPVISWCRTQPPGYGQLCGCSTHLISAALYAEHIAPLDDALLSAYPHGGMIHLCGAHAQHIPTFRRMRSLAALQLNDRAAHDLGLYYKGLRSDQILYVNPCPGMPVEEILRITGGDRTVVCMAMDGPRHACANCQ